jgi:DNA transformation protein and related proteins
MNEAKRIGLMRNLGPFCERQLAEVGVRTEAELRSIGSVAAYMRLRFRFGRSVSRNFLWAMAAALQGCHWRDLSAADKQALLAEVARAEVELKRLS